MNDDVSTPDTGRDRGRLVTIGSGPYRAELSTVGAIVESLTVGGRDLLLRNPPTGPMLFSRGAVIAPWPNRIRDGKYTWGGQEIQAPINEVERGNALHGLICFQDFTVSSLEADRVVLGAVLYPSPAYPFRLQLYVEHALAEDTGLTTSVRARNLGDAEAPYGVCPHPYVVAGPEPLEEWTVRVPAKTLLQVTPDRLLPTGTAPVTGTPELDLTSPTVLGSREIDHAYTDLQREADGLFRVRADAPGGTGVEVSADARCPWVQVHTADRPEPEYHRKGLAVEPMTCPPDAFNSGTDVVRLAPGAEHTAAWSIRGW